MSVHLPHPPTTAGRPAPASGAVALSHWGLMRADGADARSFLHGQLTNDVNQLGPERLRLAGFCSAKGRLQASFLVWPDGADGLMLACHAGVLPATLKRLSMFVLRAKCKLSDAGAAGWAATGLVGEVARHALASAALLEPWRQARRDGGMLLALPPVGGCARAVWVAPAGAQLPAAMDAAPLALEDWLALEVQSGLPMIEPATVDQFVPQMINFELIAGVDFRKGCYPGQEVVARSQYRGTTKRRMFLFSGAQAAAAGQEVFHSEDPSQPAGMVVNAARGLALVEVKLAAMGHGEVRLGHPDGPALTREPLPYEVPMDVAADA